MKEISVDTCPLCGGQKTQGTTTFTVDLNFGVIVVRNVPAFVCYQCGADWITDDVAAHLEETVENARRTRRQVEVTVYKITQITAAMGSQAGAAIPHSAVLRG